MSDCKWRHFRGENILWGVRWYCKYGISYRNLWPAPTPNGLEWYCKYGISYRNLEEMLSERGVSVGPTTLYRRVQHHAPEMERRLQPGIGGEVRLVERAFGRGPSALAEAAQIVADHTTKWQPDFPPGE